MHYRIGVTTAIVLACLTVAGCSKDSDEPKYRELKGKVSSIDPTTGQVGMTYYNEKRKTEQALVGKLAPDAEILIDGATATLADVRIDDEVVVTGRVEKRDGEPQLVATQVRIQRREAGTSEAATKPAEGN